MGFFGGGKDGNESGGSVNGKHRGKPAKGKGGLNKPLKGKRHSGKPNPKENIRHTGGFWDGGYIDPYL